MIIIWVAVDGSVPVRSNILYTASVLARSRNPSSPSLQTSAQNIPYISPFRHSFFSFLFLERPLLFVAVPSLISKKLAPMSITRQKSGKTRRKRETENLFRAAEPPPLFFSFQREVEAHETHWPCHRYAGTRQIDNNTQGVYGIPSTRPPRRRDDDGHLSLQAISLRDVVSHWQNEGEGKGEKIVNCAIRPVPATAQALEFDWKAHALRLRSGSTRLNRSRQII